MTQAEAVPLDLKASCGDRAAALFLEHITGLAHFWDDLIDRDKTLTDADINQWMMVATVWLPGNPFYRAHYDRLAPIVANSIVNWLAATQAEREDKADITTFAMRSAYCDLVATVALICGGLEHSITIAREARARFHSEGMDKYLASLADEKRARGE